MREEDELFILKEKLKVEQDKNISLRSENKEFRGIIIDLQNKLLDREGEYAKSYVKEYVAELEQKYLKEVQPFVKLVANEEDLFKEIQKIIKDTNKTMYQNFMTNTFDVIVEKYKDVFLSRVDNYLQNNHIEQDLETYVKKRLNVIMSKYKTEELNELINFIVKDVAKKTNIELSKEIVNEMSDMSVIQVQSLQECLAKISKKEQSYIQESMNRARLLESGK